MPYIQLSQLSLPTSADRSIVFPFLYRQAEASGNSYRVSLLVSDRNPMAQAWLETLQFTKDPSPIALPGGSTSDRWSFFRASDSGPLRPLSDDGSAPPELALGTYLSFGALTSITAEIEQPASITVVARELDEEAFNPASSVAWSGIDFAKSAGAPAGWRLQFAAADNTVDATDLQFRFPIVGSVPSSRVDAPGGLEFGFDAKLAAGPSNGSWPGTILRIGGTDDFDVVGGAIDRLPLDNAVLVTSLVNSQVVLVYEWEPLRDWSIPLGDSGLFNITLADQPLRIRFASDGVGVHLFNSSTGAALGLRSEVEFPLIMAKLSDAAPEALALVLPLIDQGMPNRPPALRWSLSFDLDTSWEADEQPIFHYTAAGRQWQFGDGFLDADWPLRLVDRTGGMAFGGLQLSLADLLGDILGPVAFSLAPSSMGTLRTRLGGGVVAVPVEFNMAIGSQQFNAMLRLEVDLKTFRLTTNKLLFRFPIAAEGESAQILDFGVFAILVPNHEPGLQRFGDNDEYDGYIDFEKREFALTANQNMPAPWLVAPGNLQANDGLSESEEQLDIHNRLLFKLDGRFNPDEYQPGATRFSGGSSADQCYFRVNGNGVSLHAEIDITHSPTVFPGDDLSPAVTVTPAKERSGKASHIVLVDNAIREAAIFAEMDVPGVDDLVAEIEIGLRQKRRGEPPTIYATVDLEKGDQSPVAQLTAGYVQLAIDKINWTLSWDTGRNDWNLQLPTDLRISVAPRTGDVGGLDKLRDPDAIKVAGLDLMNLHKGAGSIALNLDRDVEFDCLNGMFGVRLNKLGFSWGKSFVFECETAEISFRNPGAFDVTVEVGGVHLEFMGGTKMKMRNPSRIGITASIGDSVKFRGAVAWVDNDRERFFAAAGTLSIDGLPEATTLLKIGSGVKENGQVAPNIALYGAADFEVTLFSGVVAKNFGAGIGINNRLKGIGERPTAEEILANIDSIDPSQIENWDFVSRNGFYLSIVGTAIIASAEGGNSSSNAYVAALVLSIDLDLNIVAAGKLWLFSSVDFVRRRDNWRRPALVGAIALITRERLITAAIESRPNPAIESNDRVAEILNKGSIKLSFVMSPSLVDFFLKEVSYRDEFLGIQMLYQGSLRFAIFRGVVLLRASQAITGQFNRTLSAGPGGFSADGALSVQVEFGGLISERGLAAYGMIAVSISLNVRAWITIEFSFTVGCGRWKKRIGFSKTFNLGRTRLELGLRGAVAFNESAQFGFDGELSISIAICGYRLSIAPSLRFNEGVIAEVRGRVAAFEQRIEAYREQLLKGTSRSLAAPAALGLTAPAEEWLLYHSDGWMFLVPKSDSPDTWLTPSVTGDPRNGSPPVFSGDVRSITIQRDEGGGPTTALKLLMPWDSDNQTQLESEDYARLVDELEESQSIMAETAAEVGKPVPTTTRLADFRPVSDPRYKSLDREFWTDEDRVQLPDYALPIRLRSAEDAFTSAMGSPTFESDLAKLIEYVHWRQRAIRVRRHQGGDRDRTEDVVHNRGAVNQLLLDQLGIAAPDSASVWIARETKNSPANPEERFGFVFQMPGTFDFNQHHTQLAFTAAREGAVDEITLNVVSPTAPDVIAACRELVTPLPARQQFVIDQPSTGAGSEGERGRVVVKLPIAIDDQFLQNHLASFSHFRVYRRFPWQERAELVGDQMRPELTYIEPNEQTGDEAIVVVGPFIFTDEFPVTERMLSTPGLQAEVTQISYSLEFVAVGDFSPPSTDPVAVRWPAVRLHVPEVNLFPSDLGMVLELDSLFHEGRDGPKLARFALVSSGTEGTPIALLPSTGSESRELLPHDFELWAEPIPLSRSGFYAGALEGAALPKESKTEALLDNVSAESDSLGARTTDGLFLVGVQSDPAAPGWFRPVDTARFLQAGFGYRFFVRPVLKLPAGVASQDPLALGLVTPVSLYVVRDTPPLVRLDALRPRNWQSPPRLRPMRQLELIPRGLMGSILNRTSRWTPLTLSERPLDALVRRRRPQELRRHLGFEWSLDDARQGGVEIIIRDLDDTALESRLLCETIDEADYQRRISDFRNASLWQLSRLERSIRLTWNYDPGIATTPVISPEELAKRFVLSTANNPVLARLTGRMAELHQRIDDPQATWVDVFMAAKNWMSAIYEFQKSPINLNDEAVRESMLRIRALLRHLFTGRTDSVLTVPLPTNGDSPLDAAARKRIDDETLLLLREIEETDASRLEFNDETEAQRLAARRALVDLDLAKRLAAIIRRREVIAEEVFDSSTEMPPSSPESSAQRGAAWLPRGQRFEELRAEQVRQTAELAGELPLSKRLLDKYNDASHVTVRIKEESQWLKNLADFSDRLADRLARAAGVVANAAGMIRVLNRLDQVFSTAAVTAIRRPHHQVTITTNEENEKQPEAVSLEDLLSDAGALEDQALDLLEPPYNEVTAYLNFLERMGFALDLAAIDSLGDQLSQQELQSLVRDAKLIESANQGDQCRVHIIVGREPDSEYAGRFPDPDGREAVDPYVGHAFLKVVVVPREFYDLLTSKLRDRTTDNVADRNRKRENRLQIKQWLDIRKITSPDDSNRMAEMLERFGRIASYVTHDSDIHQLQTVRLEVRDRRWVSVPAVDDRGHVDWLIPDTRGRRFEAICRYVSRYEPLIRWGLGIYDQAAWPESGVEPATVSVRRLVTDDLQSDLFIADVPENVPVTMYPHPELIQFGYTLPSAAARSMLNLISAIRTGYQGMTTVFRYELRDHDEPARLGWDKLLQVVKLQSPVAGDSSSLIADPPTVIKPTRPNGLQNIRLTRNERLMTLRDMPYYYQYRFHVRSNYDAEYIRPGLVVPDNSDSPARREPVILAMRPAEVTPPSISPTDLSARIEIELRLTRTGDLLTTAEWAASPPLEQREETLAKVGGGTGTVLLSADQLPEPSMGYHFYYAVDGADYFIFVAELLMPWHPAYKANNPTGALTPWFRLMDSRAEYVDRNTDEWPEIILGQSEHGDDSRLDQPAYKVKLQFKVTRDEADAELLFAQPERRRMQASRAGKLSDPIQ